MGVSDSKAKPECEQVLLCKEVSCVSNGMSGEEAADSCIGSSVSGEVMEDGCVECKGINDRKVSACASMCDYGQEARCEWSGWLCGAHGRQ